MNKKLITLLALPVFLITACVSSVKLIRGDVCESELVSDIQSRYDIEKCVNSLRETIKPPLATFTISGKGDFLNLIEFDHSKKSGVRIFNHNVDEYGNHHFAVYQEGGPAWTYVFPPSKDDNAVRYMFEKGKYETNIHADGKIEIKGEYFVVCLLKRI